MPLLIVLSPPQLRREYYWTGARAEYDISNCTVAGVTVVATANHDTGKIYGSIESSVLAAHPDFAHDNTIYYGVTCGDYVTATYASGTKTTIGGVDYYLPDATLTIGHTSREGYVFKGYIISGGTISGTTLTIVSDDITVGVTGYDLALFGYNDDPLVDGSADHPYVISTTEGWNQFCDCLKDNDTWNRFSGMTVKLGANITVSRMAGGQYHDFTGTFDGQQHTLTFNYGEAGNISTDSYIAPFRNAESGCIIQNLHVAGDIYTSGQYAAGILCSQYGTVTIRNCRSSVCIHSSHSGDGTHGGLVANNNKSASLTIEGCLFDGKLLTEGATATTHCGGFVGWRANSVTITNSLYAPATLTDGETEVVTGTGDYPGCTFARNGATLTNCYYTRTLGTEQGKAPLSVTAGDGVTVSSIALTGDATEYTVSGITAYSGGGIERGGTLYYGSGDNVSLTLSNTPPTTLHTFDGYNASNGGTLSGSENPYTLTMPDADVTVNATWTMQPVTYLDAEGKQRTCTDYTAIYNGNNPTTLGAGWYVVTGTVSYDGTVTIGGDVHLILADGCQMNIGSEGEGRINGDGIRYNGNMPLTIYGQSAGSGTLSVYTTGSGYYGINVGTLTINGGHVTANTDGYKGHALFAAFNDVTINGGNVTATTTGSDAEAIHASKNFNYNGGNVTTSTASGKAIWAYGKQYNFNWRSATDRITIGATGLYTGSYTTATFTSNMTDGYGNIYTTTTPDALATLNERAAANDGLTLQPCLAIISYDGNGSTSQEWVTYVAETNLAVPVGLTAYIVGSVTGTEAVAEQVSYLPEDVPVLLHRSGTDVNSYPAVAYDGETTAVAGNLLQVADADNQPTAYQDYALYGDEFVLLGTGELASGVVFLRLPANGYGARSLSINVDETADMYHVPCTMYNSDDAWYDLQGRKIVHSTSSNSTSKGTLPKGVYIYKGKKVIIK